MPAYRLNCDNCSILSKSAVFDLIHGVVARIDQQLLIVVNRAGDRLAKEAGDNASAVVIGL